MPPYPAQLIWNELDRDHVHSRQPASERGTTKPPAGLFPTPSPPPSLPLLTRGPRGHQPPTGRRQHQVVAESSSPTGQLSATGHRLRSRRLQQRAVANPCSLPLQGRGPCAEPFLGRDCGPFHAVETPEAFLSPGVGGQGPVSPHPLGPKRTRKMRGINRKRMSPGTVGCSHCHPPGSVGRPCSSWLVGQVEAGRG